MLGGPQYQAEMVKSGLATKGMVGNVDALNAAMSRTTKRSWEMNQAMYTARRFMFFGSLAVAGMAASVAKLGFTYLNTMNTARVAFEQFLPPKQVKTELNELYVLAARTPFTFPDIVTATRRLYPFIGNLKTTNMVVKDIVNSLSAMGLYSTQYLNRASLALGHMFALGRLTGQVLYQLARDNIPMQKALEAHYHATGLQIKDMVSKGLIPAAEAAKALHQYELQHGFASAAFAQATKTLPGAYSTFKDILGLAAGQAIGGGPTGQGGIYGWLQKNLAAIDSKLIPVNTRFSDLHITLTRIATVINNQITPGSNAILNTFLFLEGVVKGLVGTFMAFYKVINAILTPLDKVFKMFDKNASSAKALGYVVGSMLAFFIVGRGVLLGFRLAMLGVRGAIVATTLAQEAWTVWQGRAAAGGLLKSFIDYGKATKTVWNDVTKQFEKQWANNGVFARMSRRLQLIGNTAKYAFGQMITGIKNAAVAVYARLIPALSTLYTSVWIWLTTNPFGWLLIAVTAFLILISTVVILYFKWKWFHDIVNDTAKWLWKNYWVLALIVGLIPGLGPMVSVAIIIAKNWGKVVGVLKDIYRWMKKIVDYAIGPFKWFANLFGSGSTGPNPAQAANPFALKPNPLFTRKTPTIFQQAQPPAWWQQDHAVNKIITPQKRGTVQPHAQVIQHAPQVQSAADIANFIKAGETHVTIQLDRKTIATAVARANQDKAALK